jgi:hypothetical protein
MQDENGSAMLVLAHAISAPRRFDWLSVGGSGIPTAARAAVPHGRSRLVVVQRCLSFGSLGSATQAESAETKGAPACADTRWP